MLFVLAKESPCNVLLDRAGRYDSLGLCWRVFWRAGTHCREHGIENEGFVLLPPALGWVRGFYHCFFLVEDMGIIPTMDSPFSSRLSKKCVHISSFCDLNRSNLLERLWTPPPISTGLFFSCNYIPTPRDRRARLSFLLFFFFSP